MPAVFAATAPKRPANLTVNEDLLEKAKALGINLSAALEAKLEELVRERLRERWLQENREAITAYNEHFESRLVFGESRRSF